MATKESLVTYQAQSFSDCLDRLVAEFGYRLEGLTAIDKLDLLGVLAFWQSTDTDDQLSELPAVSLDEYLELNSELQAATSHELDFALKLLSDCTADDATALMVSLSHQIREGVFAE